MAVNLPPIGKLTPVPGVLLGTAEARIRYSNRHDVAVIVCDEGTTAGGVFTQNSFRAPPVFVAEAHQGSVRGLVINSGNANAATGTQGIEDANAMCECLGDLVGCEPDRILPFSTGVIGEFLPMDRMKAGIETAFANAAADGWISAAEAIMTTDTAPKGVSAEFEVDGCRTVATTIAKGSGMACPDMATMLAYLGTDAGFTPSIAKQLAIDLAEVSFNRITIDGDTSTNDCFVVFGTGRNGAALISDASSDAYSQLLEGLTPVARELAMRLVRDGEGATKFVTVRVRGGRTDRECLKVAYTIAHSPLVKTAIFAGDPNWGRICMAIGRAGIDGLDANLVSVRLDDQLIMSSGLAAPDYDEPSAAAVMSKAEFDMDVDLGRGSASAEVWTTDLSYEYIKVNAEYRS